MFARQAKLDGPSWRNQFARPFTSRLAGRKGTRAAEHAEIKRSGRPANRSGGQHLAAPYEGPGAIAQRQAPAFAPERNTDVSAASRADNGTRSRIGAIWPRDSIQPARR